MSIIVKKYKILNSTKAKTEDVSFKDKDEIQSYIKKTWYKFLPAALGGGILQINLLVDTFNFDFEISTSREKKLSLTINIE